MRDELERVRDWAKGQIRIGSKAPASWGQYVTLIESADAVLHEMAVAAHSPEMAPPSTACNLIVETPSHRGRWNHKIRTTHPTRRASPFLQDCASAALPGSRSGG